MTIDPSKLTRDRINHALSFVAAGVGPGGLLTAKDNAGKEVLALEDACRELAAEEQLSRQRKGINGAPSLTKPQLMTKAPLASRLQNTAHSENHPTEANLADQAAPLTTGNYLNGNTALLQAMLNLQDIFHKDTIGNMRNRLKQLNVESEAIRLQGHDLVASFEEANIELRAANQRTDRYTEDVEKERHLLNILKAKGRAVAQKPHSFGSQNSFSLDTSSVQKDVAIIPETMGADAQTASHPQSGLTRLDKEIATVQLRLDAKEKQAAYAVTDALVIAKKASTSHEEIERFLTEVGNRAPGSIDKERHISALGQLAILSALLKELIGKLNLDNALRQKAVLEKIDETACRDAEKKAKECEASQKKAEETSKAASCASKILSYVMIAVSVVATVATLGAASALMVCVAAVGIAMAVADVVLEATGNSSLMQMLAKEIATGITKVLVACGVPKDKAEEIGKIVGVVLAAVAFLLISLVSLSSFVKNMASSLAKFIGNGVLKAGAKLLPKAAAQAVRNTAGKVGDSLSQSISRVGKAINNSVNLGETTLRKVEIGSKVTGAAVNVNNVAISGTLNIISADYNLDAKNIFADLTLNTEFIRSINELIRRMMEALSTFTKVGAEHLDSMIEGMHQSQQNQLAVVRSIAN
ncbi:putative type III secretion system effector protein [Yersinia nurmii]|uniref:Type III secretion system effector protein n=1 Tax=Yersinia nurmii TaxID=685706 RepID=A0ABM9SLM3_9GAMM|nr:type III secretion system translocon subunit SctE [Yersinia nurmii]CNF07025.1 putative type III secretion system effector protein [Yersinia nurmii]